MKGISVAAFADAQTAEIANWEKDVRNPSRVLHELTEHSLPAGVLRELGQQQRFRRALEVGIGCFGLGFLAVHVPDLIDSIDGVDPLPRLDLNLPDEALASYVHAVRNRVHYHQLAAERLPFPNEAFDLVACINVVDHAQAPAAIIQEINRVLKPGGLLVFAVSILSMLGEWKWKLNRWRRPTQWLYVAHPHTFRWRTACQYLQAIPGETLWSTAPGRVQKLAGHGRMGYWLLRKAAA